MKFFKTSFYHFGLFVIIILTIHSCGKDFINDPQSLGLQFYPVEIGNSWTYRMDSIIYDDEGLNIYETTSFMKEEIIEKTIDAAGDSTYILQVSKRRDETLAWQVTDLYYLYKDDQKLKRVEENLSFLKLVFPTTIGSNWNGNQFDENLEVLVAGDVVNVFQNWGDYRIKDKVNDFPVSGAVYDNVLVIEQADESNNIQQRYSFEYYKENIGLIMREMKIKDIICTGNGDCQEELDWDDKGDAGFTLRQSLIEYE